MTTGSMTHRQADTDCSAPDLRLDTPIRLEGEPATQAFGARLAACLRPGDVVALQGDLGSGKTTLARAVIQALTTPDQEVPSPTFTLVQTYATHPDKIPDGEIWHFDLYRITDPVEVEELSWDEAVQSGIVLVEWADRLAPASSGNHPEAGRARGDHLPDTALEIRLEGTGAIRTATVSAVSHPGAVQWEGRFHNG